ncbi:uncharacterized protein BDCG_07518 [Blastomyces dermatitidis ER-3]|uniref:Translation regulator n=1 Tax=Ajellomyces dermatitidis (strain ER-3 / ATCC MYA-2586) TaxID=559297 RepID=A0ABP2F5P8_AJEDR|nr:uncharacterized protein BDCG_07518 [Blastomyces dermatitidis ER-3]EEQ92398.1 hypothetical protein BDCG_07518 [Blastomyces dermatitidis ER-3]
MLERAAQRLENAGECLFRHSKRHARSRRVLHPEFWHHGVADIEAPLWSFDYMQPPRSSPSTARHLPAAAEPFTLPHNHLQNTHLEFLYPPETQVFARYCLPHIIKNSIDCRRRLGSRPYSTNSGEIAEPLPHNKEAVPQVQEELDFEASENLGESLVEREDAFEYYDLYKSAKKPIILPKRRASPLLPFVRFGLAYCNFYRLQRETMSRFRMKQLGLERSRKTKGFRTILPRGAKIKKRPRVGKDGEIEIHPNLLRRLDRYLSGDSPLNYRSVWKLYHVVKDQKPEYHSRVLAYLSESREPLDRICSRLAFEAIEIEQRTPDDYGHVTKSLIQCDGNIDLVRDICKEAVLKLKGEKCWDIAMVALVDQMKWKEAFQFFSFKPSLPESQPFKRIKFHELSNMLSLPERVLSLLELLREKKLDLLEATPLVGFLVHLVIKKKTILRQTPIEQILLLFYSLNAVRLLESQHYFWALSTLRYLDIELKTTRALQVYWHFRLLMDTTKPPEKVLAGLLKVVAVLRKPEATNQLLREFRLFYEKPSEEAYQIALTGFSRLGDFRRVTSLFNSYVGHYGQPRKLNLVNPLIHVNAAVGKVYQARKQLERLRSEFSLSPDVTSWNIVLTAHAKARDKQGALSTYQEMIDAGLKPDSHTLGILMGLFAKDGSVESVMDFLQVAKGYDIQLNMAMLHPVVETLCNNRKYAAAEQFADSVMKLQAPGPTTRMWNVILWHYAFLPDLDSMLAVHDRMRKLGVKFDHMTYAATILALVRTGNHDDAIRVIRRLENLHQVSVTQLHYSILLYGYALIGDLEMIEHTQNEIMKKFGHLNLSSRLSVLKGKIHMDKRLIEEGNYVGHNNEIRLVNAEEFLASIMKDFGIREWATKAPQPGANQKSVRDAFPSAYYEELISAYRGYDASTRAKELAEKLEKKQNRLIDNPNIVPLSQLAQRMKLQMRDRGFDMVEKLWSRAFDQAKRGTAVTASFTPNRADDPDDPKHITTGSMSTTQRFSLSECLSVLMECYAEQNLHSKIAVVISQVQKAGFALTTHNWSFYIELLAVSSRREDRLNAFILFEKLFIPNYTGWKQVRARSTARPSHTPSTFALQESRDHYFSRRPDHMGHGESYAWSKLEPDHMQPSYDTMVRLAAALVDARARSVLDAGEEVNSILLSAPLTIIAMGNIHDPQGGFGQILNEAQHVVESSPIKAVMEPGLDEQGLVKTESSSETTGKETNAHVDTGTNSVVPSPYDLIPVPAGMAKETSPDMALIKTLLEEDVQWREIEYKRRTQRRQFLEDNPSLDGTPPRLPPHLRGEGRETGHWHALREVGLLNTPRLIQHAHLELPERSRETLEEEEETLSKERILWRKEELEWRKKVKSGRWKDWIPARNQRLWLKKIDAQNLPLILQYLRLEEDAYDIKDPYRKEWVFWCRLQIWRHMKEDERVDWMLYHEKNRSKRWRGLREWREDLNWIRKKIPRPDRVDGEFASDQDREAHSLHYHAKTRLNQIRDMMAKVYKLAYQDT